MNKIRKGDEVVVITGRDKGRRGTVIRVLGEKVLVENVNMVKRHTRPNPQKGTQGGIVEKEAAAPHLERAALEPGREEGRSRGYPHARRRQARALFQVQRRSRGRLNRGRLDGKAADRFTGKRSSPSSCRASA